MVVYFEYFDIKIDIMYSYIPHIKIYITIPSKLYTASCITMMMIMKSNMMTDAGQPANCVTQSLYCNQMWHNAFKFTSKYISSQASL